VKTKTKVRTHAFLRDPVADDPWSHEQYCVACGLPKKHESHAIPEQSAEVIDLDERRTGERRDLE